MKIHYNKEFNCFEAAECHKTDVITLDGTKLISIEDIRIKVEKLKTKNNTAPWATGYNGGITCGLDKVLDLIDELS